nr:holo-ACP synthase [Tanacetum cinerariifolium]
MSHTSSLIACGMTIDSSIGIDVEEKKGTMKNKILSFAKWYFANEEVEVLRAISDRKEAYIKALGRRFSGAPFNTFTLWFWSANPNHEDSEVEIMPFENQSLLTTNCQFSHVDLAGSHYAAICRETNGVATHIEDKEEMTAPSWEKRIAYVLCNYENMVESSKL